MKNKWVVKRKKLIDSETNQIVAEFTKESNIVIDNVNYKTLMTEDGGFEIIILDKENKE